MALQSNMAHSGLGLPPLSRSRLHGQSAFFGRIQSLKATNAQPRPLISLNKRTSRLAITARSAPGPSSNASPASPRAPLFELFPEGPASRIEALSPAAPSGAPEASSPASGPRRVAVGSTAEQKVLLLKMYTTKLSPGSSAERSTSASAASRVSRASAPPVARPTSRTGGRSSDASSISLPAGKMAEGGRKASKVVLRLHSVKAGETLHSIAKRYGIPADAIRAVNEKAASGVRINEILFLPSPARMEDAANAVQGLGGEQAVILLSPKARMLLRKATVPAAVSQAEADASSNSGTLFNVFKSVQSALDRSLFSQGHQTSLELLGVTASDVSSPVARQLPGTNSQAGSREGSTSSAVFASVQAASPFGARGLYGAEGEYTASAIFGRSSLAIGICLLLLGSASSLQSFLLKQLSPEGALLGKARVTADTDARDSLAEPLDPAQRTARRYLNEVKTGGQQRTSTQMLLEYSHHKLGIPTGDEILLRRTRNPRDLVTELGCIDTGLCLEVIESSDEEEAWMSQASELEYFEAHAASVKPAVAGLVAAVEFNPDWDVKMAREANMRATSSEQA